MDPFGNQTNFFRSNDNKKLFNLALMLLLILSIITLVSLYASRAIRVPDGSNIVKTIIDPFLDINIEAKSVLVFDIANNKIIYSKEPDTVRPLASITKVLTAVTAFDLLPKNTVITMNKTFLSEEGDSGLLNDEKWDLTDLISFSLIVSSNDGAAAIASVAGAFANNTVDPEKLSRDDFIKSMNIEAEKIGMTNSYFYNETGLDIGNKNGGYGTATDIATLFAYALKKYPEILLSTRHDTFFFTSLNNINHRAKNTDIIINNIPGILASKTGYTDITKGNLAVVFDAGLGRPIAVVVLGSSFNGRFSDVQILVDKTFEYINQGN